MADLQWKQKGHTGGFSDDRFIGIRDSFAYAKGVEIRKNPHSLKLAKAVEKNSGSIVVDLVNAYVTIKSTGDILAFGNAGNIYRKTAGAGDWVKCYTQSGTPNVINAIEYNDYLYWATSAGLHRIPVSGIDNDWATGTTPTLNYKAFTVQNTLAKPMLELNNQLYVGDGYNLCELSSAGVWTEGKITIFHDEYIRALTFGGSMMRLFSRKSDKVEGGQKYFWDGAAESYNERVAFSQAIHCAISDGGNDYVIAGKQPILYSASGYDWIPLKRLPLVSESQSCYIAPNAIDYYDRLLVFAPAESGTNSIGRGAWTYGQLDQKYPMSLNFEYPTSNDNATDIIGAVHNSNGVLYFSWKNGSTYGIDMVNTGKYRATGELHSLVHYGNEADTDKGARAIRAAFATILAGEKIQIFAKKDLASAYPSEAEIEVDYANVDDRTENTKEQDQAMIAGDYNFLETKVVLTAGTGQLTSPELIEMSIVFDPEVENAQ